MAAEEQVCVVYAGVRGYLDKVVTSEISRFESLFLQHLRANHPHILEIIRTTGDLSKDTDAQLKAIVESFIPESGLALKA